MDLLVLTVYQVTLPIGQMRWIANRAKVASTPKIQSQPVVMIVIEVSTALNRQNLPEPKLVLTALLERTTCFLAKQNWQVASVAQEDIGVQSLVRSQTQRVLLACQGSTVKMTEETRRSLAKVVCLESTIQKLDLLRATNAWSVQKENFRNLMIISTPGESNDRKPIEEDDVFVWFDYWQQMCQNSMEQRTQKIMCIHLCTAAARSPPCRGGGLGGPPAGLAASYFV